jgi:hypothetical protein
MRRFTFVALFALMMTVSPAGLFAEATPPPTELSLGVSIDHGSARCAVGVTVGGIHYQSQIDESLKLKQSASGNILFQCSADLATPAPEHGLVIDSDGTFEFACYDGDFFTFTTDWQIVITPSGKLFYSCHA